MPFYENYLRLCQKAKKTPSGAALEMGLSKPTVNRWKNGGGVTDATAIIVADYFGVSVEMLMKDNPSPDSTSIELVNGLIEEEKAKQRIKKGLPQGEAELTDAQKEAWEIIRKWDDEKLKKFIAAAKAMLGE